MSRRMRQQGPLLEALSKLTKRQQKQFLKSASDDFIHALGEGSLNILKGNVRLNEKQFRQLKRYKKHLQSLANKRIPIYNRRRIVEQKGGFIGLLASVLVPTIASLIGSAVSQ